MARRRPLEDDVPALSDVVNRLSGGYTTVGELVYAILREAILTGALQPGQKLGQEAIAEAIGVSRIPVRSAIIQLETEGLVVFKPHRGAVVATLTAEKVRETYSVRALLEAQAIKLAIRSMTPERAERLVEMADRLDDPERTSDFLEDRVAFYHELYGADENPVLVGVIDQLRSSVGRDLLGLRVHDHAHSHRGLVDLVVAGDLPGARRWVKSHLDAVCAGLLAELDSAPETYPAAHRSASRSRRRGRIDDS
ncbi:GntR family transcriptional regulator [Pseudonocardia kunmingensis]|uniref:GntR family transcriptional regulator n=1 Tax=Pseudonocardia kunmingensis TaxID=630975 RepID=A0A543DQL2_9PSEU|nr:GntR family transcriptional regulator [Pseudonocardia kunmingensis]TQM11603.1 GntR family transcriptional regulator [Pseudonocardia kunmingensis]